MDDMARLLGDLRVVGEPAGELGGGDGDGDGSWYRLEGRGEIGLLVKIRSTRDAWEYVTHTTYNA